MQFIYFFLLKHYSLLYKEKSAVIDASIGQSQLTLYPVGDLFKCQNNFQFHNRLLTGNKRYDDSEERSGLINQSECRCNATFTCGNCDCVRKFIFWSSNFCPFPPPHILISNRLEQTLIFTHSTYISGWINEIRQCK